MVLARVPLVLTLGFTMLLCACATRPVVVQNGIAGDNVWSLNGRIGISSGKRHGAFTVDWRQDQDDYNISLLGPMGVGAARITRRDGMVTLQVPNQDPLVARSADELLSAALGLHIPVTPLRYWVRGKPAPGYWRATPDGFVQSGWTISYLAYASGLPVKMVVSRPEVKMTMVVRKWMD